MKKLLSILEICILSTVSINYVISCQGGIILKDDSSQTINDIEIFNKINQQAQYHFEKWWSEKEIIDINNYSD